MGSRSRVRVRVRVRGEGRVVNRKEMKRKGRVGEGVIVHRRVRLGGLVDRLGRDNEN